MEKNITGKFQVFKFQKRSYQQDVHQSSVSSSERKSLAAFQQEPHYHLFITLISVQAELGEETVTESVLSYLSLDCLISFKALSSVYKLFVLTMSIVGVKQN